MFGKILVGTDGSETASKAVQHAADIAAATGGELIVVSAYPSPKPDAGSTFGPAAAYPGPEIARSVLADAEKRLAGHAAKVRTAMREGDPADAICDVAEEERADLIIVGNRGMTGAKRFLLGSVPNNVSHHAPCSVLIVHTTE
ncbi:MAG: universal stress protein [Actinomycetota bacterium]